MRKESKAGWLILFVKLGPKLATLGIKLLKTVKVGKFGFAAATAATYAYLFTWQFAAALMVALFVHESGHVWAMKRCGMKVKGIYFIPFLGAAAVTEDSFKSRWSEAFIALAGPVWGMALAIGAAIAYEATKVPIWAALAAWMAMLNLFNLLPVNPLDGGRVLKSLAYSAHSKAGFYVLLGGILVSAGMALYINSILFAVLAVIGAFELWGERKAELRQAELELRKATLEEQLREAYAANGLEPEPSDAPQERVPGMSKLEFAVTAAAYLFIAGTLFYVMDVMKHEPGAELARQVLIDDEGDTK